MEQIRQAAVEIVAAQVQMDRTVVQAHRKCQVEVTVATGCKDRMTVMMKRYRGQMDRTVMEKMQMKPNLRPA